MERRGRSGFTLIELLVVIAIIAILAAILFPVFARARAKAKQATCLSNLRQVGLAWRMYTDDYSETTPIYHYFYASAASPTGLFNMQQEHMMYPYMKNAEIFGCPERLNWSDPCGHPGPDGRNYCGWAYNMELLAYAPYPGIGQTGSLAEIEDVSGTFLWADSCCHYGGDIYEATCPRVTLSNALRHNDGVNAAFCDGHGKWQKEVDITDWTAAMD